MNALTLRATLIRRLSRGGRVLLALLVVGGLLAGCETARVKEINGRKVIGTRRVDGRLVYVLEKTKADEEAMVVGAEEAEAASRDVVFKPLK